MDSSDANIYPTDQSKGENEKPRIVKKSKSEGTATGLDLLSELSVLRELAAEHKRKLVEADRMPTETMVSKLVAEAASKYREMDEQEQVNPSSRQSTTSRQNPRQQQQQARSQPRAAPEVKPTYRAPTKPSPQRAEYRAPSMPPKPAAEPITTTYTAAHKPHKQPGIGSMPRKQDTNTPPLSKLKPPTTGASAGTEFAAPKNPKPMTALIAPQSEIQEANFFIDEVGKVLNQRFGGGVGIVFGVGTGFYVKRLLSSWTNGGLYIIDPFIKLLSEITTKPKTTQSLLMSPCGEYSVATDKELQLRFESLHKEITRNFSPNRVAMVRDLPSAFKQTYKQQANNTPVQMLFWNGCSNGCSTDSRMELVSGDVCDATPGIEKELKKQLNDWWPLLSSGGLFVGEAADQFIHVLEDFAASQNTQVGLDKRFWYLVKN